MTVTRHISLDDDHVEKMTPYIENITGTLRSSQGDDRPCRKTQPAHEFISHRYVIT